MIVFRQKEFLKPSTRIAARSIRLARRVGLINPMNHIGEKGKEYRRNEIRSIKSDFNRSNNDFVKNVREIGSILGSTAKATGNAILSGISGNTGIPRNYQEAKALDLQKSATAGYINETKKSLGSAKKSVGNLLSKNPIALVGPVIPAPGATEILSVLSPHVSRFTPVGEVVSAVTKPVINATAAKKPKGRKKL